MRTTYKTSTLQGPRFEEQREYWDERWNRQRRPNGWQLRRGQTILELVASLSLKRPKILDLGCATGWFTAQLSRFGTDVVGIDLSEAAIELAKRDFPGIRYIASNIFETRITQSTGARLTADSLQCVAGATSVCLVRGNSQDGTSGEVLVGRSGVWSRAEIPYVSSAGYLALRDVDGDGVPEVVAVQQDCGDGAAGGECQRVFAEVFTLSGNEMGCTRSVGGKAALPGWPVVAPVPAQLRSCRV